MEDDENIPLGSLLEPGASAISDERDEARYYLSALIHVERGLSPDRMSARLLARCWRISARVERLSASAPDTWVGALLDLGRCSAHEAREVAARLAPLLRQLGRRCVIRIGPTPTSAELAALAVFTGATPGEKIPCLVPPARLAAWLRDRPVSLLAQLDPARALAPEVIARLAVYGLRTLGQVARLDARDPQALRRQYGADGARLAALCHGEDMRPLQPEQPAPRIARRRCFAPMATADEAYAALPSLARALARRLEQQGREGGEIRLSLAWESGAVTRARRRLARPLYHAAELTQAAERLLESLLHQYAAASSPLLESLTLALGNLTARLSARPEPLFALRSLDCATHVQRERTALLARIAVEVNEPLTQRYGAPALYRLAVPLPDAILPEERTRLVALDRTPSAPVVSVSSQRKAHIPQALATSSIPPEPHWW